MPTAIVTGASRGLGLALARALARDGWRLVIDARGADVLQRAAAELRELTEVEAFAGTVADRWHREVLAETAGPTVDLLVNNASVLGPSPQPELHDYPLAELARVMSINAFAPLGLVQLVLPRMPAGGRIIDITSDASVEAYPGWGGYGAAKAALDHLTAVLAVENPHLRVYAADPGDMRTRLHQEAFPDEDISDRPPPEESVPGLLALVAGDLPSGRYRVHDLVTARA